jgi:hypothetical protein
MTERGTEPDHWKIATAYPRTRLRLSQLLIHNQSDISNCT